MEWLRNKSNFIGLPKYQSSLMQIVRLSVYRSSDSFAPSLPTPDALLPPKGMLRSRNSQQLAQTVPTWSFCAIRWVRLRSFVQTTAHNPYLTLLARSTTCIKHKFSTRQKNKSRFLTGEKITEYTKVRHAGNTEILSRYYRWGRGRTNSSFTVVECFQII